MVPTPTLRLLMIEDNAGDARLVTELLREVTTTHFDVQRESRLSDAIEAVEQGAVFDVVLLDLSLPDSHGLNTLRRFVEAAPELPVVINSGQNDESVAIDAISQGAQDYLVKGRGDGDLIARALRYAIDRKRSSLRLSHLAYYDQLTGLPNRLFFQEKLAAALERARRHQKRAALLFLDLDRFKEVNDVFGHEAGDQLLFAVARRLKACVRSSDTVARLGGDEFTVILEDLDTPTAAAVVCRKVMASMAEVVQLNRTELFTATSIGIACFPDDGQTVDELLRHADAALYSAKSAGRGSFQYFDPALTADAEEHASRYASYLDAFERDQFEVFYLPQIDLSDERAVTFEALLRWRHPDHGLMVSSRFVPFLEESGLIVRIGEWVLEQATRDCASWREAGKEGARVSVNISLRQLKQPQFEQTTLRALERAGLPAEALDLEVTEDVLDRKNQDAIRRLAALRERGVRVSIDDFGVGYSSLGQLAELPVDSLKVHPSFVRAVSGADPGRLLRALVMLGQGLGKAVIAEGAENELDLQQATDAKVSGAQGFAIGRPMASSDVLEWESWPRGS